MTIPNNNSSNKQIIKNNNNYSKNWRNKRVS